MNERIKELAEQARNDGDAIHYYNPAFVQKFAELIVRECSDVAYQSLYEDRAFDDSPSNIRRNVMDAIRQHFGVE